MRRADAEKMAELIVFYCNAPNPYPVLTEVVALLVDGKPDEAEAILRQWRSVTREEEKLLFMPSDGAA